MYIILILQLNISLIESIKKFKYLKQKRVLILNTKDAAKNTFPFFSINIPKK